MIRTGRITFNNKYNNSDRPHPLWCMPSDMLKQYKIFLWSEMSSIEQNAKGNAIVSAENIEDAINKLADEFFENGLGCEDHFQHFDHKGVLRQGHDGYGNLKQAYSSLRSAVKKYKLFISELENTEPEVIELKDFAFYQYGSA